MTPEAREALVQAIADGISYFGAHDLHTAQEYRNAAKSLLSAWEREWPVNDASALVESIARLAQGEVAICDPSLEPRTVREMSADIAALLTAWESQSGSGAEERQAIREEVASEFAFMVLSASTLGAARNAVERHAKRIGVFPAAPVPEDARDRERLDWLEREVRADNVEAGFSEAGDEPGEYGAPLSSWPAEFWLYALDHDTARGPTLRAAIDAAMRAATRPPQTGDANAR